jgi:hypothetical protein
MTRVAVFIVCYTLGYRTYSFTVTYEPEDDPTPLFLFLRCLVLSRSSYFSAYGSKRKVRKVRYSATGTRKQTLHLLSLLSLSPSLSLSLSLCIYRYPLFHFYLGQLIIKN